MGLSMYWKRRVEDSGHTIESLLTVYPYLIIEAWVDMWGWYRYASNRPPPTASVSLKTLTEENTELYTNVPPPGKIITIEVAPFPEYDNILGGGILLRQFCGCEYIAPEAHPE